MGRREIAPPSRPGHLRSGLRGSSNIFSTHFTDNITFGILLIQVQKRLTHWLHHTSTKSSAWNGAMMTFNIFTLPLCEWRQPNQKPELGSPYQALNRYSRAGSLPLFSFMRTWPKRSRKGSVGAFSIGLFLELVVKGFLRLS